MIYFLLFLAFICAMLLVSSWLDPDFWKPMPYTWCPKHYDQELTERGWCPLCKKVWKL